MGIFWLIARNASAVDGRPTAKAFLGHIQMLTIRSLTLGFCKLYEDNKRQEQFSIPAIIRTLRTIELNASQQWKVGEMQAVSQFAGYAPKASNDNPLSELLSSSLMTFKDKHKADLRRFRSIRDQVVAHPDSECDVKSLPSFEVQSDLYAFALRFYQLIAKDFVGNQPALMTPHAETSLLKIMVALGMKYLKREPFRLPSDRP